MQGTSEGSCKSKAGSYASDDMIVGCKDIPLNDLRRACSSHESLLSFALGLVPTPLRHLPQITDNQKYLVALYVRSLQSIDWQKKKYLCENLLMGVSVKGVSDVIYDYTDILAAIDPGAFKRYLEEASSDASR